MPTIQELGQKTKAKYPQYADMSDLEVGKRVKEKYPTQYADFADVSSAPKEQKSLGQKVLDVGTGVSNFFGGKGVSDLIGASLAKATAKPEEKKFIEFPKAREVVGSAIQLGANFLPGAGIGATLGRKALVGAGTGLALDVGSQLQDKDKKITDVRPGIGTAIGGLLPVGGEVAGAGAKILGRLTKGLGSGLSGVSTKTIDSILENPKVAQEVSENLAKSGNSKILEQNAKQIVNGVSTLRQSARKAYGEGVAVLKSEDIKPTVFRKGVQDIFDKYGFSTSKKGKQISREITNAEFRDVKNLKKANTIANMLTDTELNGLSLNKTLQRIDDLKYPSPKTEEGLAFNAFVNDVSGKVKQVLNQSTDKLGEINKAFSQDMQLVEAVEDIFGKVNYKNLPEVVKASKKLETLFAQKGLAPDVIDDFLKRIDVSPANFKTSEAVRQITDKTTQANTKGLSVGELIQQVTSSVITPQLIRDISIKTGIADKALTPLLASLKSLSPALQKTLIQALLQAQ